MRERYGEKDPRVLTLRSILSSCEIAEAVMQLVFNSVERALGDSESLLSKALNAAFKVGIGMPARFVTRGNGQEEQEGPLLPGDLSSTQITFEEEEVREEHEELPHA